MTRNKTSIIAIAVDVTAVVEEMADTSIRISSSNSGKIKISRITPPVGEAVTGKETIATVTSNIKAKVFTTPAKGEVLVWARVGSQLRLSEDEEKYPHLCV
jgi:hypothetical protein